MHNYMHDIPCMMESWHPRYECSLLPVHIYMMQLEYSVGMVDSHQILTSKHVCRVCIRMIIVDRNRSLIELNQTQIACGQKTRSLIDFNHN